MVWSVACRPSEDGETARLAHLSLASIRADAASGTTLLSPVWMELLPRLRYSNPLVATCLAAVGAATEESSSVLTPATGSSLSTRKHYGAAIRAVKDEITCTDKASESFLIACTLLACTELILGEESNALVHLQSAMALFPQKAPRHSDDSRPGSFATDCQPRQDEFANQDLYDFFLQLDTLTASYALGLPPRMSPLDWSAAGCDSLKMQSMQAIHNSYHAAIAFTHVKYSPPSEFPHELLFEQGRHVGVLQTCIGRLSRKIKAIASERVIPVETATSSVLSQKECLIIRSNCLSAMVYLLSLTRPYERDYDDMATIFDQIINDARSVLACRQVESGHDSSFVSPSIGILQPLFFTAIKYRHNTQRQQATALLRRGGREGPFHGAALATIAARASEIEADRLDATAWPDAPPEVARLHGAGMSPLPVGKRTVRAVEATFSRCVDVEAMLKSTNGYEDPRHWETWTETLLL